MIALHLLAAIGLAASPGGYRLGPAQPIDSLALRQALIVGPTAPTIHQTTLQLQQTTGAWSLGAQLPVVASWEPGWQHLGMGQLRLSVRRWTGPQRWPIGLLMELALPAAPTRWRTASWGSVGRETLPAVEALVGVELSGHPAAPWCLRLAAGLHEGPYLGDPSAGTLPVGELLFAQVLPLPGPLALVGEAELIRDLSPLSLRALLRADLGQQPRLSLDLGSQWPLLSAEDSVQLIAQARASF